jgi:ribonuclease P/MRP protein subunit RPP1
MAFYDYCILADSGAAAIISMAAELGWDGLCLLGGEPFPGPLKRKGLDVMRGLLIEPAKASDVKKEAAGGRKVSEIIAVRGTDEAVNRAAVETPQVDLLLPAPGTRIDYKMARLAVRNGVRLAFEFTPLVQSSGEDRGRIFSIMAGNAAVAVKFRAPFAITSGALSEWDLRAPGELASFARALGFSQPGIREALSASLIRANRKKLGGKWISPGVEVE